MSIIVPYNDLRKYLKVSEAIYWSMTTVNPMATSAIHVHGNLNM